MRGIMKTVKPLEDSGLLIKDAGEPIENEAEEQKHVFICILFTLDASLLRNMFADEGIIKAGAGVITAKQGF